MSEVLQLGVWEIQAGRRAGRRAGGRTLGGPSNDIDSLGVLLEGCEVLDFAILSMDLDLPQLRKVRRMSICKCWREGEKTAAYSNIGVSSGGCETTLARRLEMGRVDGLALVMPIDNQRICSHGDMWSAKGPFLVAYESVVGRRTAPVGLQLGRTSVVLEEETGAVVA